MTLPFHRSITRPRAVARAAFLAILVLGLQPTPAADVPDGMWLGRWIIAPHIETNLEVDSNLLRRSDAPDEADRSASAKFGIEGLLPFRNSSLALGFDTSEQAFQNPAFDNQFAKNFDGELELNFASGDTLTLSDSFTRDYIQLRDEFGDAGGGDAEETFIGEPYNFNRWTVALERDIPDHQGYLMRIRREDFVYKGDGFVGFFDRRGFDTVFEYRQPMPAGRSLVAYYNMRRFNHYDPNDPDSVGVPFRKEESDYLHMGLRGNLAASSYLVRLGLTRFQYKGQEASKFQGISGFAYWRTRVGGVTALNLSFSRRPLASNFTTYYINNVFRLGFDRNVRARTVDFNMGLTRNRYADLIDEDELDCGGELRDDFRFDIQGRLRWKIHERFALQLGAAHERRRSNCPSAEYVTNELKAGVVLGWY